MKKHLSKIIVSTIFLGVFFYWHSQNAFAFTSCPAGGTCTTIGNYSFDGSPHFYFETTYIDTGYLTFTDNGVVCMNLGSGNYTTGYQGTFAVTCNPVVGHTYTLSSSANGFISFSFNSNGTTNIISNPSSEFIEPYYPLNGSFSTTSPTTFSGSFFNSGSNPNLDTVSISLTDTTSGEQTTIPAGSGAVTGYGTFSATIILNLGDNYLWRPVLSSSGSSSTPIYGSWYSFLASSSPNYTPLPSTVGTATSSLPNAYNLLSFLNVPQLLSTKAPFAYIFEIASGIEEGVQSSSSNAIPSGNFVWYGIGNATTTFDFFSTSTIGYYLSPTIIADWRAFLLVCLTIEFGYALYTRAKSQHLI